MIETPHTWSPSLARIVVLLAIAAQARPGSVGAAVVVLGNQSEQSVKVRVAPVWGERRELSLAPGDVVPIPVADSIDVAYVRGEEEVAERIDPNTVHQFVVTKKGGLQLEQVRFSQSRSCRWWRVPGQAGPPPAVVVPVTILADDEYAQAYADWHTRLRGRIIAASESLEEYAGVRLDVVAQATWESDDEETDFRRLEARFRQEAVVEPAWLAIGVTGQFRISEKEPLAHVDRAPFCTHVLLPEVQEGLSEADQLALVLHELCHFLGAAHSPDEGSVMRSPIVEGKKDVQRRPAGTRFDAINTLAMRLVAEEIRQRRARHVGQIERGTRAALRAMYGEMARRVRGDRQPYYLAELLRESLPPSPRYTGKWTDGTRRDGDRLGPWHQTDARPALADRPLLAGPHPIRWLVDNSQEPADPPDAMIEFVGGDRLPGRVIGVADGHESPDERMPPHLLVAPHARLDLPNAPRTGVRVNMDWIRRVVFARTTDGYHPRTLLLRDGRRLDFRSVRLTATSVRLLREEGIREVPLADVAEIHFPTDDPWDAYFEQLVELSPDGTAGLVEVETTDGLRATSSSERFQASSYGSDNDPAHWHHLVQPAWSLDALWVRHRAVRVRRYFSPHEVRLSRIDPIEVRGRSDLGVWPWQVDENVEGGPLRSGGRRFPWGIGVHGETELEFPLPDCALALHCELGLDELAGDGGCVEAKVFLGSTEGQPLFASGPVVGSANVLSTGRLDLEASSQQGPRRLTLHVDALHDGRPQGADPFDVRDTFDWLEPIVELDARAVQAELLRRGPQRIPAWQGWQVTTGDQPGARLVNHWDQTDSRRPVYRLMAATDAGPLRLTRRLQTGSQSDRLLLAVSRPSSCPGSRIEVEIDGQAVAELEVPIRRSREAPDPLAVSLSQYEDAQIAVSLCQRGDAEGALVEWREIALEHTSGE